MSEREDLLEARVAELESRIETLEARMDGGAQQAPAEEASVSAPAETPAQTPAEAHSEAPAEAPVAKSARPSFVHVVDKIGIALLLLGVAFLLKYSYDQGWLTETFRVVLGALTGTVLLSIGVWQRHANRTLSAVLNGGAIATFYGTVFAAFELYDLIPATAALAITIGITMLGFVLSVRQDQPALASIATVGGFATPFLMEGGPDAIPISVFAGVVLAGTSAIYLFKGWRSLLVTMAAGGFAVVAFALDKVAPVVNEQGLIEQGFGEEVVAYGALAVATIAAGIVPALRAHLNDTDLHWAELLVVIAGMLLPLTLVPLGIGSQGFEVVVAAILAVTALGVSQLPRTEFTYNVLAAVLVAAVLGLVAEVDGSALMLLGLAVAYGWTVTRHRSLALFLASFVTLSFSGLLSLIAMLQESGEVFGTPDSRVPVFAVASLVALGFATRRPIVRWGFFYTAMLAGMTLLATQLDGVAGGEVIVTSLWGATALAMLIAGFVRGDGAQQALGIIAVLLTAGKLLFFDLEAVATIIRVALFMGMGAALLFLSYLVPRWEESSE